MNTLILIPARGGSKRLPGKNLRCVGGKSLVRHAVECGRQFAKYARIEQSVVLCDTDDRLIAAEAKAAGAIVPFLREAFFATGETTSAASTLRLLFRLEAQPDDVIVLLQPTSPLRTVYDVQETWDVHHGLGMTAATQNEDKPGKANGAVYIITAAALGKANTFTPMGTVYVGMPPWRSVDVDTAEDLAEAERIWKESRG